MLRVLVALFSFLDKYASHHSNSSNKSVMNAVKGYDDTNQKALETHANLYSYYNHIKHKLFKHI